jgi:hypothetical protein
MSPHITVTLDEDERKLILDKMHHALHNLTVHDSWRIKHGREPMFTPRIEQMHALINKLEGKA